MSAVKIGFVVCLAIEVFIFCSVWYKLRKGQARIGGLSMLLTSSAIAFLWTLSYLFSGTLQRDQIYLGFGWLPVLLWGYISLSREDRELLAEQKKAALEQGKGNNDK